MVLSPLPCSTFRKLENVVDELLDIAARGDYGDYASRHKLECLAQELYVHDLQQLQSAAFDVGASALALRGRRRTRQRWLSAGADSDFKTSMGSVALFTVGFVYSAGVWDSLYFVLFALGCSAQLSFFVMAHLLLALWLFSGCFVLKAAMPTVLRYIGYYANPVRLTLKSQFCAAARHA